MQMPAKKAQDVMYSPVVSLSPQKTIAQAIDTMTMYSFSQIPVITEEGQVVGSLTERTLLEVLGSHDLDTNRTVETIMAAPFPEVRPDTPLAEIYEVFSKENPHAILVVDEEGVQGIICKIDLIRPIVYNK